MVATFGGCESEFASAGALGFNERVMIVKDLVDSDLDFQRRIVVVSVCLGVVGCGFVVTYTKSVSRWESCGNKKSSAGPFG